MNLQSKKLQLIWGTATVSVLVAGLFLLWHKLWSQAAPTVDKDFPLPPYSQSRYLNSGPDTQYIGVAACAECHERQHKSYLHTAHSRALGDPDLDEEPPDGAFFHKASGRSYRVYRKDKSLWHEEVLHTSEGKEIARLELPIRYRIGSGSFTRSYLVEIDGFLHESPITWYASKQRWDVSPGYDVPNHPSFERAAEIGCVACHAGRVEPVDDNVYRVKFHEQVIGCESCHGPGSLHQKLHGSRKLRPGEEDYSIVNPGKLSRPLLEAVCATCHPSGIASIPLRGRQHTDIRPGRPLSDYRLDYRFDLGDEQMTVVGHLEQLRRSACYQKSSDLTCITCHDLHARDRPRDPVAHHRQRCLDCHATHGCSLDMAVRLKKDARDNCVACHMPRGDTDIPHIAFTHHRIGRHPPPPPMHPERVPELIAEGDLSSVPPLDRKRNLGMAYVMASQHPAYAAYVEEFRQRAEELLTEVHAAGLRHDAATAALFELLRDSDRGRAREYGQEILQSRGVGANMRTRIQLGLASFAMQEGHPAAAASLLEGLVKLRRSADDWRLLGMAQLEQDQPTQALAALQQALAIRPYRAATHQGLAEAYRRLGDDARAREHAAKADWLAKHRQD